MSAQVFKPCASVHVHVAGGIVDVVRYAHSKQPESWLALNAMNAEQLGKALLDASAAIKRNEAKGDF